MEVLRRPIMKRHVIAIVVIALAAALTFTLWGTLKGVASAHRTTGTVVGTFRIVGGPPPGINMAIRGTAIFIPNLKSQGAPGEGCGEFNRRLQLPTSDGNLESHGTITSRQ